MELQRRGQPFTLLLAGLTMTLALWPAFCYAKNNLHVIVDTTSPTTPSSTLDWSAIGLLAQLAPVDFAVSVYTLDAASLTAQPVSGPAGGNTPTSSTPTRQSASHLAQVLQQLTPRRDNQTSDQHYLIIVSNGLTGLAVDDTTTRLDEVGAELAKAGIQVFSVDSSMSEMTNALQRLAAHTNGWHIATSSREESEKSVVQIMEHIAHPNSLPIVDSLVRVDETVSSLSLLVFRNDKNLPAELTTPMLKTFSQFNAPKDIRWYSSDHFEVVHIDNPQKGTWQILTNKDTANRLYIRSTLALAEEPIPTTALPKTRIPIRFHLVKNGHTVAHEDVLDFIVVKVSHWINGKLRHTWFPMDDGKDTDQYAADGRFAVLIEDTREQGIHEFVIDAETIDFQRQSRLSVTVHTYPVLIHETRKTSAQRQFSIVPRPALIVPDTLVINAALLKHGAASRDQTLSPHSALNWSLTLTQEDQHTYDTLELNIAGTSPRGVPLSTWLNYDLTVVKPSDEKHRTGHHSSHTALSPTTEGDLIENTASHTAEPAAHSEEAVSGFVVALQLITVHLALAALGYLALRWWRRREARWMEELGGALKV